MSRSPSAGYAALSTTDSAGSEAEFDEKESSAVGMVSSGKLDGTSP